MRRVIIAAALVATAGTLAAQTPRQVTLTEAITLGAQTQPAMVQARQDIRTASAQDRQARAAFLPSLSTSLTTSRSGGARASQFGSPVQVVGFYNSSLRLSANWDLFTGFRRGAQRRLTDATVDQRDATLLRQEYAIAQATKEAFFTALATAELVTVAETRLRRANEQLTVVSERLRLGATTRSDSLRARVEQGNAQLTLIQARADARNAQTNLARAIGVEGEVQPVRDTTLEIRLGVLDTARLRSEALSSAPTVREADASVFAAQAQRGVSRAAYLPTVSLGASNSWLAGLAGGTSVIRDSLGNPIDTVTVSSTGTPFGGRYVSGWNVSLTVSYPLFNNLTRETSSITSDAAYETARARARDARLLIDANLTQAFASLEAAAARIDVARVSVAAAGEDLRMQQERYRLGAATIFEVLTSQVSLDQAQVDLVRARYDYLIARAAIEALVGHGL